MFTAIRPALFALDAERAHGLTIATLRAWQAAGSPLAPDFYDVKLATQVGPLPWPVTMPNPIGIAAGFDKDARVAEALLMLGFGFVEVGTLTLRAQAGNPRPRLFRLAEDRAVINRMGFNNGGLAAALPHAGAARWTGTVGINVGANKDATDAVADIVAAVGIAAGSSSSYVTINISSPNTPGLRDLQHGAALRELLAGASAARQADGRRTPLFLKVAPDLDAAQIDEIAKAAADHGVDALIVTNTTVSRPPLRSRHAGEAGGLSGAPLAPLARQRLADFRRATGGAIPLVSAGGIDSGAEAYARIRAGASLIQLYSALVYEGPGLPRRIARELAALLARDGFKTVAEAVGTG